MHVFRLAILLIAWILPWSLLPDYSWLLRLKQQAVEEERWAIRGLSRRR